MFLPQSIITLPVVNLVTLFGIIRAGIQPVLSSHFMSLLFKCSVPGNKFGSLGLTRPPYTKIQHHFWHLAVCFLDLKGVC
jgi:hypothetical protein